MSVRQLHAVDVFADPSFPFHCEIFQAPGGDYPEHTHEFTELEIIFQGSAIETIDGRDYAVAKGSVLAMTGAVTHATRQTANALMFMLQMDAEKLAVFSDDLTALPGYHALFVLEPRLRARHAHAGYLKLGPHDLAQVEGLALRLRDAWRDKHPGHRYLIRALLMELIGYLCQVYAATDHAGAGDMLRIAKVLSYLEQHYEEELALADILRQARMGRNAFHVAFRRATGLAPVAYLIRHRLQRAIILLRTTSKSVTDIGLQVGFSDANYFARKFHEIVGVSPRAFRVSSAARISKLERRLALPTAQ